jgi:hypothetical protein
MGKLFDPSSTTMAFINGSFEMLGAKIASGIFDSIATVLEKLPFMGTAAAAVREAQKEAEKAVEDISNIMYYEADNLKSEWGGIMAEMPKEFADSYRANMEKPLFDMQDRAAETASQMEAVAEATREAAFSAEKFGQALRDAKVNQLAGPVADSPVPDKPAPGIFGMTPEQVAAADEERARNTPSPAPTGGGGGGGGSRMAPPAPKTAKDYETEMRAAAAAARHSDRARSLEDRGFYEAAGRAMERADKAGQAVRDRADVSKFIREEWGAGNMGEAYEKYRRQSPIDRYSLEEFEKRTREMALTDSERRSKDEERGGGERPASGADPMAAIMSFLTTTFGDFKERVPQNALS